MTDIGADTLYEALVSSVYCAACERPMRQTFLRMCRKCVVEEPD